MVCNKCGREIIYPQGKIVLNVLGSTEGPTVHITCWHMLRMEKAEDKLFRIRAILEE